MLLIALLVFFGGMTLFNVGGTVSGTGQGEVMQVPAARSTAQLTIKRVIPTTIVVGTGFRSGELVRFRGIPVRQVRTSPKGTFTIRFGSDPCSSLSITATGSKGSRAAVNYSQLHCAVP